MFMDWQALDQRDSSQICFGDYPAAIIDIVTILVLTILYADSILY
jgi:hypothetical protein